MITQELIPTVNQSQQPPNENKPKESTKLTVQIEFCHNCDAHLFTIRHQESKYHSHYENLKKKLNESNIAVKRKTPPDYLYKKSPYCPPNVFYHVDTNEIVYFPQIGSFQIYFDGSKIFSKLQTLKWPNYDHVLAQVLKKATLSNSNPKVEEKEKPKVEKEVANEVVVSKNDHKSNRYFIEEESKKRYYRIKQKLDEKEESARYSLEKRNLFVKPGTNYLERKSLTSRQQVNSQKVPYRKNTTQKDRLMNEEQISQFKQRLRDEQKEVEIMNMYSQRRGKPSDGKSVKLDILPLDIPTVANRQKKHYINGNVYLQPIFPKTSVNLQNFQRQKFAFSLKIHEQKKSYEISKHLKESERENYEHLSAKTNILNAKFNENANILHSQELRNTELHQIKEITQQNEAKIQPIHRTGQTIKIKTKENTSFHEDHSIKALKEPIQEVKDMKKQQHHEIKHQQTKHSEKEKRKTEEKKKTIEEKSHVEVAPSTKEKHEINEEIKGKEQKSELSSHNHLKIVEHKELRAEKEEPSSNNKDDYEEQFEPEEEPQTSQAIQHHEAHKQHKQASAEDYQAEEFDEQKPKEDVKDKEDNKGANEEAEKEEKQGNAAAHPADSVHHE